MLFVLVCVLVMNMSNVYAGLEQKVFIGAGSVLRRGLEGKTAQEIQIEGMMWGEREKVFEVEKEREINAQKDKGTK